MIFIILFLPFLSENIIFFANSQLPVVVDINYLQSQYKTRSKRSWFPYNAFHH